MVESNFEAVKSDWQMNNWRVQADLKAVADAEPHYLRHVVLSRSEAIQAIVATFRDGADAARWLDDAVRLQFLVEDNDGVRLSNRPLIHFESAADECPRLPKILGALEDRFDAACQGHGLDEIGTPTLPQHF